MSRCKFCKKPIKWIEVAEDTPSGSMLRWKTFDKRRRAGEPYRPHQCHKQINQPRPLTAEEMLARRPYKED